MKLKQIVSALGFCIAAYSMSVPTLVLGECLTNLGSDTPLTRFQIDGSVVIDRNTGLMWKRCAEGYAWLNGSCSAESGSKSEFTWQEALQLSENNAKSSGYENWRLPNKNELNSIVDRACFEPSVNPELFPNTASITFWTNTPNTFNASFAWAVEFQHGAHITIGKNKLFGVRLVRDYP